MGVTVTGLGETAELIERLVERARNLLPVLSEEAVRLKALIDESWESRVSPSGAAWADSEGDGGTLRTAHTVTAGESSMTILVEHEAASFQFFGTEHVPPRNPLPVERDGTPSSGGRAGEFWREHKTRLETYLAGEE